MLPWDNIFAERKNEVVYCVCQWDVRARDVGADSLLGQLARRVLSLGHFYAGILTRLLCQAEKKNSIRLYFKLGTTS